MTVGDRKKGLKQTKTKVISIKRGGKRVVVQNDKSVRTLCLLFIGKCWEVCGEFWDDIKKREGNCRARELVGGPE